MEAIGSLNMIRNSGCFRPPTTRYGVALDRRCFIVARVRGDDLWVLCDRLMLDVDTAELYEFDYPVLTFGMTMVCQKIITSLEPR